ncbi:MAG: ribulose-phosphate 3-epimerase [Actinomycetia bacterium]|nr:ribulose-phosphate 3-epimerase [Actinomycetes bacterium]
MKKLAPSILSADFGRLAEQLAEIEEAGAHLVHVDVMDGHFVPNITIGPLVVKAVKKYTNLPLDVHLMIDNPGQYVQSFADAGASSITFHAEAVFDGAELVGEIKSTGTKVGIAINPDTSITVLNGLIADLDQVTIMSVHPGFGGQKFIETSRQKIFEARKLLEANDSLAQIEVDGGITTENAASVIEAGADILVAGAAVFGGAGPAANVKSFLEIL